MLSYFKNFVELRTKVASVFPFLYVLLIYLTAFDQYQFSWPKAIIFFISMVTLDMATTVLNHLAGMHREQDISLYDQRLLGQMTELGITTRFNYGVLITLVSIGVVLGIGLAVTSSPIEILIGGLCVSVAITYSYGPIPLKNTFLGEVASGVTMGGLIPLAFIFIQDSSIFITEVTSQTITINYLNSLLWIIVLAVPMLVIANIMLANNICDIDKDLENGRVTLPILIGAKRSKQLWLGLYTVSYLIIIILGLFKPVIFFGLITSPIVFKHSKKFVKDSQKAKTFKYAVFNLQLVLLSVIIPLAISLIINYLFI